MSQLPMVKIGTKDFVELRYAIYVGCLYGDGELHYNLLIPLSRGCRMGIRERINIALKDAMKAKEVDRLSTLRLINAAIKDRDISVRTEGRDEGVSDDDLIAIMGKMVKQRHESARAYEEGGRLELAEKELSEIRVIEDFLPRQLTDEEVAEAIEAAIEKVGAETIRDMGKVMGELKKKYSGQMDFGSVGPVVKSKLG